MAQLHRTTRQRNWVLAAAAALAPLQLSGQVVRGTVRDSANTAIRDVLIAVVDSNARVLGSTRTDERGIFRVRLARGGTVAVFARRLGFQSQRSPFYSVAGNDSTEADLVLQGAPLRLSAVLIRSQRDSIRTSRVFGMDMRTIGGTIITPAQIDQSVLGARDILDVFSRQSVIGFSVDEDQHCIVHNRGFPRECLPAVVDGMLVADGHALRDMVAPEIIDYMMVLRGHEVGVLFGSVSEQGIVVVVTKMGVHRGPR